ncbi:MAG TPA: sterol desaturase family protein [Chitinophagales bacterium]|nr:sterol desaturase family protein [Chitinophagales bacterium]
MEISFLEKYLRGLARVSGYYFLFAGTAFFLFYVLFKKPMWFRKIQPKTPTLNDYKRDILYSVSSIFITATVIFLTFQVSKNYNHVYYNVADYGIVYWVFTLVWMLFLHDTWFYWTHRAIHHPLLYKKVHLIHHKSSNPSPWTAFAFHPFEAILEASIFPLVAFLLPVHSFAILLFFVFHTIYNVYGHLGFEILPKEFHKTWFGKWLNTSTAHNLHHHKFNGNYGLYFVIWDRLMGTLREDYDDTYNKVTTRLR